MGVTGTAEEKTWVRAVPVKHPVPDLAYAQAGLAQQGQQNFQVAA